MNVGGEKGTGSPSPTKAIPVLPVANDDPSWISKVVGYLLSYFPEVVPNHFPDLSAFFSAVDNCNSNTLEAYIQAYYGAKFDIDRKACKSILDSDSPKVFPKLSSKPSMGNKFRESFLKAFSDEYKDDRSYLKTFTNFIDRCVAEWRLGNYLASYTSLVHSSGTGKSQLVKEFANE